MEGGRIRPGSGQGPFNFGERVPATSYPLPTASYNNDMVRYYRLGLSSDDPILKYLAFYQVLEYLFVTVYDEKLYQKLTHRLQHPGFFISTKNLDRIIQDVDDQRKQRNEESMLKIVLEKYIDTTELSEFISAYESHLQEKIYTNKRVIFGTELRVNLEKDQVVGDVATTIKTVRNALVHSSDRYEREDRHIPFSESTVVRKELPLLKFLSEKVISGSARELSSVRSLESSPGSS